MGERLGCWRRNKYKISFGTDAFVHERTDTLVCYSMTLLPNRETLRVKKKYRAERCVSNLLAALGGRSRGSALVGLPRGQQLFRAIAYYVVLGTFAFLWEEPHGVELRPGRDFSCLALVNLEIEEGRGKDKERKRGAALQRESRVVSDIAQILRRNVRELPSG